MRRVHFWFGFICLCAGNAASANVIEYQVSVNTSSLSGSLGSLDLNFNPGPLATEAASLQILNFSTDGTLDGIPTVTADVTGTLPSSLTFDNASFFNDYFQGFSFGTALTFDISLYGPALSSPDGVSTSGSSFAFRMFSDSAGTIPALTTDTINGFAVTVNINLDGTTTLTDFSPQTNITPISATPEPNGAALGLLAVALVSLLLFFRRVMSHPTTTR
jgi:hypothetical protein